MPVKNKNRIYGKPQREYSPEDVRDMVETLECVLGLTRKPVGVRLYFDQESYEGLDWPEPDSHLAYCCIVEKATRGRNFKSRMEKSCCDGGTTALFTEPSTERIESGMEYFSYNLYATPAAARRVREGVPGLYRTGAPTWGIAVGPLEAFEDEPDVVLILADPYQVMRLQQGNVYRQGGRLTFTGASMQAICAEATVEPYLTGRMNVTPLCPSTRFLARWADSEMAVGIPWEQFMDTAQGVLATLDTTDSPDRKNEIAARLKSRGKTLENPEQPGVAEE